MSLASMAANAAATVSERPAEITDPHDRAAEYVWTGHINNRNAMYALEALGIKRFGQLEAFSHVMHTMFAMHVGIALNDRDKEDLMSIDKALSEWKAHSVNHSIEANSPPVEPAIVFDLEDYRILGETALLLQADAV